MPVDHSEASDHVLQLTDGRRLGYAVYGDPDGTVVLNCHGGLLSRLDAATSDDEARELGVCLLSPDRPGIALSDRWPGHDTAAWVSDVVQLLDRLGVERFAVLGWSLGGQYAAAVAAGLGDRVTRAAIVAGCVPLDGPAFDQLNSTDRLLARLSRRAPPAARIMFHMMGRQARRSPARADKAIAKGGNAEEQAFVHANGAVLARAMEEGMRDTRGVVDEYRAFVGPWGFRLEDVRVPVDVWQGSDDVLVPAHWAPQLHAALAGSTLHELPGEGHLIGLTRRRDVLVALLGS